MLGWLTTIAKQALANDTTNGWFLTQDVANRSMADYEGEWQSVYPYLKDGSLKKVMEAKAKKGTMSAEEYTKYYDAGYKTDVERITIKGAREHNLKNVDLVLPHRPLQVRRIQDPRLQEGQSWRALPVLRSR